MSKLVHRDVQYVLIPVGERCELCRLACHDGSVEISVHYGPKNKYGDTGNPLVALNRSSWVCESCLRALAVTADGSKDDEGTGGEGVP